MLAAASVAPARAADIAAGLTLSGVSRLEETALQAAVGPVPDTAAARAGWPRQAIRRIVALYRAHGYTQARAWARFTPSGGVEIHVDEGVMTRIVFHGSGAYRGALLRVDLYLPNNVFNEETLERALGELSARHSLTSVSFAVIETDYAMPTPLGQLAPVRELHITVATSEFFGWGINLGSDSVWGPTFSGRVHGRDMFRDDDRLMTSLHLAIPYRSFLFAAAPRFIWVYGAWRFAYRLPPVASGVFALQFDSETNVSRFFRPDRGIERAFVLHTSGFVGLVVRGPTWLEARADVGIEYNYIFGVARLADSEPEEVPAPRLGDRLRFTFILSLEFLLSPTEPRLDLRDELAVEVRDSVTLSGTWLGAVTAEGQFVWRFGPHLLIARGRGLFLAGDVQFFDERPLAGSHLRAFFGGRYWVREALHASLAARFAVWRDSIHFGVFADGATFGDRSDGAPRFALASAFGPSLHFVLFDRFAFDFYYGFGFAPVGFSHNLSFVLQTVF